MTHRVDSSRTPRTTLLILIGTLALACCHSERGEPQDPRRVDDQREELNPPWALPNRVEVPQAPGTPVSLQVIVENHGEQLADDSRNIAVFRRDPVADQAGTCAPSNPPAQGLPTYTAKIGWGDIATLSEAELSFGNRMTFHFCDEGLRKFLDGALFTDVRVQLMRSDGETSFNPPEPFPGAEPPFQRCVPVQRPLLSYIHCVTPPEVAPVRIADLTPIDIRTQDGKKRPQDVANPPYADPLRLERTSGMTPISLTVGFDNKGSDKVDDYGEVRIYGEKGGTQLDVAFPIHSDDVKALQYAGTTTQELVMRMRLLDKDGITPGEFLKDLGKVKARVKLNIKGKPPSYSPPETTGPAPVCVIDL